MLQLKKKKQIWYWDVAKNTLKSGWVNPLYFLFWFFFIIMYRVFCLQVCLIARRRHRILLYMVINHHVISCWELDWGSLKEQLALLTSKSALQAPNSLYFLYHIFNLAFYASALSKPIMIQKWVHKSLVCPKGWPDCWSLKYCLF